MGHSQAEKAASRERVLRIAARKVRAEGVTRPGITDLMKEAGLTHGGFYKHFTSREDLISQAASLALAEGTAKMERAARRNEQEPRTGLIDAYLGRKKEGLREGRRAVELVRAEKDVMQGSAQVANLAMIAAWVDDKDLACEQLESIIHLPFPLSYGGLELFPWWDPLRGDPRFEKILEEAKKPVALKAQ